MFAFALYFLSALALVVLAGLFVGALALPWYLLALWSTRDAAEEAQAIKALLNEA
ncbi:hypothetical protein [Pseudorhodoferax sp. Leaf267]|uniref:hypothetical protein n=1 Tax=Pseudorhodoferax sp. Leaf267 TaxID=1736316 RepID=UPI0012E16853|nr:hypothetical protein [Pseudorhodoferax sp. Leaf267]